MKWKWIEMKKVFIKQAKLGPKSPLLHLTWLGKYGISKQFRLLL